jgi:hypothetical protein
MRLDGKKTRRQEGKKARCGDDRGKKALYSM